MVNITAVSRPVQLIDRILQWCSAVIVLGITSWFISEGGDGVHIIFQEVIAAISVVFFLPAFLSPFMQTALGGAVLGIDVVFSYLWLTSFIFAAQDYNRSNCLLNAPPGIGCAKKYANESFIFLAFIFTFFGLFLEVFGLWGAKRGSSSATNGREKNGGAASAGATHQHNGDGAAATGTV